MELAGCSEGEMGRAWALNLPPVECQLQQVRTEPRGPGLQGQLGQIWAVTTCSWLDINQNSEVSLTSQSSFYNKGV